jgi:hypothetical protein
MSGSFIPALWSGKLNSKFYAASTFVDIANTDWQGEINNLGDQVVIQNIPDISIRSYTIGTDLTYDVPTPSVIELPIDQGFYFGFNVNDVIAYQAKPNLMNMFSDDAGMQLKIKIDKNCWTSLFGSAGTAFVGATGNFGATAGVNSSAYDLGTDLAAISLESTTTAATGIVPMITALASVLDEQNVPETDRWLIISPAERQLLMNSSLAQAQWMGDSQSILRNGKIGMIERFNVYVSNQLPTAAAGKDWAGGNLTSAVKRHAIFAGHRSALTFASQINKVETLRSQVDFGDMVRGLAIFGRKCVQPKALALLVAAG